MDLQSVKKFLRQFSYKEPTKKDNVLFQVKGNQGHIIFNRPKMMNAFSFDMYFSFIDYIDLANNMEEIKYIVIRGAGGNFSSGNDLNNFLKEEGASIDPKLLAQAMADLLLLVTEVIMKSKKPLFGLVEGKAIGFCFTQLALFDRVFASQNSSFVAPLVKLAQGPEMASSYLFPKIFGPRLASQIIIKGRAMTPQQLQKYDFLSCFKNIQLANEALQKHIEDLQELDWPSYLEARRLMREFDKEIILKTNILECSNLSERWCNPDFPNLMMKYMMNRKGKPKL